MISYKILYSKYYVNFNCFITFYKNFCSDMKFFNLKKSKNIRLNQTDYQVSTIGDNREMDQLYKTSQVSNIERNTKFSQIS